MAAMTTMLSQQTRPLTPAAGRTASRAAVTPAVFGLQRPVLRVQVRIRLDSQAPAAVTLVTGRCTGSLEAVCGANVNADQGAFSASQC